MSKSRLIPALLMSMAMVVAGCSSNNETPAGSESAGATTEAKADESKAADTDEASSEFLNAYACEPQYLVPTNTNESCGSEILSALFTPLIEIDKDKKPAFGKDHPDTVAEDITHNDDNTVFTIKLKDGFTFHNGEKVDAESYVRAWNFGADPKNAQNNASFFDKIKGYKDVEEGKTTELAGLKAVDEKTLEVTLEEPFLAFPTMLGYTAFYPMPKAGVDDPKAFNEAPIGNGPFKLTGSWQHNQGIETESYKDYPGTKPAYAGIKFSIIEDYNTGYNELLAGNLDVLEDLPSEKQGSFEADLGDYYFEQPSSSFTFLAFPMYVDGFKEKKLRQALSMAIDREAINKAVFNGSRTPADDYVSPTVDGYREGACKYCTFNPEEAKKLFEEAGGYDGTLEVWFNSGAGHEEWIEAVSNSWKQNLGIKDVKFQSMIFAEYLNKLEEKNVKGIYRLGWVADYPVMENYLAPILGTNGSSNYTTYSNSEVDSLLKKGNAAPNLEESVKLYQQADDIVLEDMPLIPIVFAKKFSGTSDRIEGYSVNFYDHVNYLDIKFKK